MFKSTFICTFFIAWFSRGMESAKGQLVVRLITVTPEQKFSNLITIPPDDEGNYDLSEATNFSSPKAYTDFIKQSTYEDPKTLVIKYKYNLTICNFSPDSIDDQGLADPERFQLVVEPQCDYDRLVEAWSSTEMKLAKDELVVRYLTTTARQSLTNYVTIQPNEKGNYDFSEVINFASQADFQDFLKQSDEYRDNTTYENYRAPVRKFFNYNLTICNYAYGSLRYEGEIIDLPPEEFTAEVIPICLTLAEEFAIQFGDWFRY